MKIIFYNVHNDCGSRFFLRFSFSSSQDLMNYFYPKILQLVVCLIFQVKCLTCYSSK